MDHALPFQLHRHASFVRQLLHDVLADQPISAPSFLGLFLFSSHAGRFSLDVQDLQSAAVEIIGSSYPAQSSRMNTGLVFHLVCY